MVIKCMYFLLFGVIGLSSCYIKGLTNGYSRLSDSEKKTVVFNLNKCRELYSDTIYAYNGIELKNCLQSYSKAILYKWDPNCSTKNCISLSGCQMFCDKNGYELFVLLEYFDLPKQKLLPKPAKAILIADFNYYKTNIADRATKKFILDVTSKNEIDTSMKYKRFLFFENGKFSFAKESLLEQSGFLK